MLRFFKRREDNFISLLIQQSGLTLKGFEALKDYMEHAIRSEPPN